jgi:OmpA-OmpF porin, OOP family
MRNAMVIGAMALAATLGSPAFADEFSGFRLGIAASQDTFESDVSYLGYFDDVDTTRAGYSAFGGWALNKWLAFEVGYKGGGTFNQTLASDGLFPTSRMRLRQEVKGAEASVIGSWWVTEKFGLFGRAGLFAWKGEVTFSEDPDTNFPLPCGCATPPPNPVFVDKFDDDGFEPVLGFGVQTSLDGALVRLEYQMGELDDFGDASSDPSMLDQKLNSLQLSIVWILH